MSPDVGQAMDRRAFLRACVGATATLALGACTGAEDSAQPGGAAVAEPSTPAPRPKVRLPGGSWGFPSPFSYFLGPGYERMSLIYDTLLWKDAAGDLVPWLASDYERSDDGLTYTFALREDVRWHDGEPLTAADVAFTFAYYAEHADRLPPFVIIRPQEVAEAKAIGDHRVEIRLSKPIVTFPELVAGRLPIIPQHVWADIDDPGGASELDVLIGSGPYRLEERSQGGTAYLYTAHDDYFLGTPFVERLEMPPVDDQLTAVLADDLDAGAPQVTGATEEALAPFRDDPQFGVIDGPLDFTVALYWNLAKGGALDDVRFRRACAMAIDRDKLVERLVSGQGVAGNPGFLPPDHPFHADVEDYPFDPDRAASLLDDAGYSRSAEGVRRDTDGRPLRFKLLAVPPVSSVVDLVIGALEPLGVELEIDPVDFPGLAGAMSSGSYDMALPLYGNVSGDPDYMRRLYASTVTKLFHSARGYANDEVDELAAAQRVAADEGQRRQLVARLQRLVANDLPFLPLYYPTSYWVFRREVFAQWAFTPDAGFFGSPFNKQVFVTGTKAGGTEIRPTT